MNLSRIILTVIFASLSFSCRNEGDQSFYLLTTLRNMHKTSYFIDEIRIKEGAFPLSEISEQNNSRISRISKPFNSIKSAKSLDVIDTEWFSDAIFFEVDKYSEPKFNMPMMYFSDGLSFVVVSRGYDMVFEDAMVEYFMDANGIEDIEQSKLFLLNYSYDPTNGIISSGDIIVSSPNLGFPPDIKRYLPKQAMHSK